MKITTIATDRKDIVKVMETITGEKAKYLGPPSFEYAVGEFKVDREGNVEHELDEKVAELKEELIARGLAEGDVQVLNIDIPLEGHTALSLKNLIYMIHSKQYLLEKAVGKAPLHVSEELVERLQTEEIETVEDAVKAISEERPYGLTFLDEKIRFSGFPFNRDKAEAYCTLLALMSSASMEHHRIQPSEIREENEKYYMRVWLVRLGLGGMGGKEVRKILLENLKGHTAFRTEADKEKWMAKNGNKKADLAE